MNEQTIKRLEVYPCIRECSIQTFNEQDKNEKSQSRILPMTDENLEKCAILQDKLPYGIYFSVNPMEEWKRTKDSVKKIQTWICDIDTWTKEEQLKLILDAPLPPSLVVESVHGFHLYYLADKDLTEEEFENGNWWLRNYYNGDAKVCRDTARVLRIPGFYHQKGDKVMVEYRDDLWTKMKYSVEYMTEAFPNQMENTPQMEKQRIEYNKNLNEGDDFWTRAGELDSKMMLEEFSGTGWMNWDNITFKKNSSGTEQIYVNGKCTGCWIDRNWLIGSGDKGWPTRIQWLKWYWMIDWKRLAEELKHKHPELDEKKEVKLNTKDLIYNPVEVPKLIKPDFTWWNSQLDNAIGKMSKWQLVILLGETGAGKTTFATFMARHNKGCCYYVLEDSVENIAKRYAMKYAGITTEEYNNWTWSDYKEELYEQGYLNFRNRDLKLIDVGHKITIETLMSSMKEMKECGCDLFFIDNLGFIVGNGDNEATQTADVSSKLLSFCLEQNVCVVLLHHFKKKSTSLDRRDISQMRWSWKLGDDAFTVVEYMRDDEQTFLKVYKDRTRWNLTTYEISYDRGEYIYKGIYC